MYLIQCPQGHEIPVPAKAAGSSVICPTCGATQDVPKLGDLRQMPLATGEELRAGRKVLPMGAKIAFAGLLLVAVVAGLTSAFAAFRWQNMPVTTTQEEHIAAEEKSLRELSPVQLITASEQIESSNLNEPMRYPYHSLQIIRDRWQRVCLTSLGIAAGALLLAIVVYAVGRTSAPRSLT